MLSQNIRMPTGSSLIDLGRDMQFSGGYTVNSNYFYDNAPSKVEELKKAQHLMVASTEVSRYFAEYLRGLVNKSAIGRMMGLLSVEKRHRLRPTRSS